MSFEGLPNHHYSPQILAEMLHVLQSHPDLEAQLKQSLEAKSFDRNMHTFYTGTTGGFAQDVLASWLGLNTQTRLLLNVAGFGLGQQLMEGAHHATAHGLATHAALNVRK